jgi:hypothetical protein
VPLWLAAFADAPVPLWAARLAHFTAQLVAARRAFSPAHGAVRSQHPVVLSESEPLSRTGRCYEHKAAQ